MLEIRYPDFIEASQCDYKFIFRDQLEKKTEPVEKEDKAIFNKEAFFEALQKIMSGNFIPSGSLEDTKAWAFYDRYPDIARAVAKADAVDFGMYFKEHELGTEMFVYGSFKAIIGEESIPVITLFDLIFTSQPKSSVPTAIYNNQIKFIDLISVSPMIRLRSADTMADPLLYSFEMVQIIIPTCKTSKVMDPDAPIIYSMKLSVDDADMLSNVASVNHDRAVRYIKLMNTKASFDEKDAHADSFPSVFVHNRNMRTCQFGHYTCKFIECCPVINNRITKM